LDKLLQKFEVIKQEEKERAASLGGQNNGNVGVCMKAGRGSTVGAEEGRGGLSVEEKGERRFDEQGRNWE
jgi:hypothetical protein